jgi:hypothetical protein
MAAQQPYSWGPKLKTIYTTQFNDSTKIKAAMNIMLIMLIMKVRTTSASHRETTLDILLDILH